VAAVRLKFRGFPGTVVKDSLLRRCGAGEAVETRVWRGLFHRRGSVLPVVIVVTLVAGDLGVAIRRRRIPIVILASIEKLW
jgi:hypothetical protein